VPGWPIYGVGTGEPHGGGHSVLPIPPSSPSFDGGRDARLNDKGPNAYIMA